MAAKRSTAPRRAAPRRAAAPPPPRLTVERISALIGLFLSVCAAGGIGYDYLRSGWKATEDANRTSEEVAKTDKKIADAKLEMTKEMGPVQKELAYVKATVSSINDGGTRYGRDQYAPMNVERQQIKKDVADLQDLTREIIPTLADIKANVRWLMANAGAPDAVSAAQANPRPRVPRARAFRQSPLPSSR